MFSVGETGKKEKVAGDPTHVHLFLRGKRDSRELVLLFREVLSTSFKVLGSTSW